MNLFPSLASVVSFVALATVSLGQTSSQILKIYDRLDNHDTRLNTLERRNSTGTSSLVRGTSSTATTTAIGSYKVQNGDTISSIARSKGVTRSSLLAANNLQEWSILHPGQTLKLPGSSQAVAHNNNSSSTTVKKISTNTSAPRPSNEDRVSGETFALRLQARDTLFSLAREYGTSLETIKALNPGLDENRLSPNTRVNIPVTNGRRPAVNLVRKSTTTTTKSVEPKALPIPQPERKLTITVKDPNKGLPANELHPKSVKPKPQAQQHEEHGQRAIQPMAPAPSVHHNATPKPVGATISYKTTEKDTWENLAFKFNTTVMDLRQRNGSVGGELIGGLDLQVPASRYGNEAEMF